MNPFPFYTPPDNRAAEEAPVSGCAGPVIRSAQLVVSNYRALHTTLTVLFLVWKYGQNRDADVAALRRFAAFEMEKAASRPGCGPHHSMVIEKTD